MRQDELSGPQRRALRAVVKGDRAWADADELHRAGHRDRTLTGLAADGWLEGWDSPDGPAWTLTPWAAESLRVEVRDFFEYVPTLESPPKDEDAPPKKSNGKLNGNGNSNGNSNGNGKSNGHAGNGDPIRVDNLIEMPRFVTMPPPRAKGDPPPPKINVYLPKRHHCCRLPNWLRASWADSGTDPAQQAIENEEYVLVESRTAEGDVVRDEVGNPKMERLRIMGQEIPIARIRGKKRKA